MLIYFNYLDKFDFAYQGKYNIFRKLYAFLLPNIDSNISYVEAYANKANIKSIGILKKWDLKSLEKIAMGTYFILEAPTMIC